MKYLIESISKFKKDLLSKGIYDLIKWLLILFVASVLIPQLPAIKEFLSVSANVKVWYLISGSLGLMIISSLAVYSVLSKKLNQLKRLNQLDELTGLPNKTRMHEELSAILSKEDSSFSLILIDIDDFKKFNSDHSYTIADEVLRKLGDTLHKDCRASDLIYRYYHKGDEFLIVTNKTKAQGAKISAERKRQLIDEAEIEVNGNEYSVTISCGITEYKPGESKEDLLHRLEKALKKQNPKLERTILK